VGPTKGESTDAHAGGGFSRRSVEAVVMAVEQRGGLSSEKVFANRGTGMSLDLPRSPVGASWLGKGWDEPCKSRGLRTVLWAAGGEIPPADPAAKNRQNKNKSIVVNDKIKNSSISRRLIIINLKFGNFQLARTQNGNNATVIITNSKETPSIPKDRFIETSRNQGIIIKN